MTLVPPDLRRRRFPAWAACAALCLWAAPAGGREVPSAAGIVARADEVRNPQLDYKTTVEVRSVQPKREDRLARYEVWVKGKDKTVIKTLAPANERGVSLLMLGADLWTFLPDVSQPVRISPQQRLIGEVSIGDVARANFSGDYRAVLLRQDEKHYVLELTALGEHVGYHRILYWVEKRGFGPAKAEFYAASGKLLKTCSYEDYRELAGRRRPSRLVMTDPWAQGRRSIVAYDRFDVGELPGRYFTKDHLKKLKY